MHNRGLRYSSANDNFFKCRENTSLNHALFQTKDITTHLPSDSLHADSSRKPLGRPRQAKGSCALALCFPPKAGSQDTSDPRRASHTVTGSRRHGERPHTSESLAWRLQWLPSSGQQERRGRTSTRSICYRGMVQTRFPKLFWRDSLCQSPQWSQGRWLGPGTGGREIGVSDPGRKPPHGNQTHRQAGHECDPMAPRRCECKSGPFRTLDGWSACKSARSPGIYHPIPGHVAL